MKWLFSSVLVGMILGIGTPVSIMAAGDNAQSQKLVVGVVRPVYTPSLLDSQYVSIALQKYMAQNLGHIDTVHTVSHDLSDQLVLDHARSSQDWIERDNFSILQGAHAFLQAHLVVFTSWKKDSGWCRTCTDSSGQTSDGGVL